MHEYDISSLVLKKNRVLKVMGRSGGEYIGVRERSKRGCKNVIIIFLLLFILTLNGFLPDGNCTTIRHSTKEDISHKTK
jgi:hypothetical protein